MVILDASYTFPIEQSLISYTISMNAVRQIIYHALEDHAQHQQAKINFIIQTAKANTRIPLAELRNITNIEASLSTIRRRLQEDHIHKWRVVDRPALTAVHAEKRLNWALEQQRWREEKWKKVIWSDESAIQKDSDNRQVWIFRHQNKQEKYAPENVR